MMIFFVIIVLDVSAKLNPYHYEIFEFFRLKMPFSGAFLCTVPVQLTNGPTVLCILVLMGAPVPRAPHGCAYAELIV